MVYNDVSRDIIKMSYTFQERGMWIPHDTQSELVKDSPV